MSDPHALNNFQVRMLDCHWPRHRCEQIGARFTVCFKRRCKKIFGWFQGWLPRQVVRRFRSTLAFDEAAPKNRLPGEGFSRTAGLWSVCQLPAQLAFVEVPFVHCSTDAGARMSNSVQSDFLKVEGLTRFCPELVVGKRKTRGSLFPVCRMDTTVSIQSHHFQTRRMETSVRLVFAHCPSSRGAMRRTTNLLPKKVGGTKCRARTGKGSEGWV